MEALPALGSTGFLQSSYCGPLAVVLTSGEVFVLDRSSCSFPQCLRIISETLSLSDPSELELRKIQGSAVPCPERLPRLTVATAVPHAPDLVAIAHLAGVQQVSIVSGTAGDSPFVAARVPAPWAFDVWLGLPFELLVVLGWRIQAVHEPPQDLSPLEILLWPSTRQPSCPVDVLRRTILSWLFVAKLDSLAVQLEGPTCAVEVQVVACTMWEGMLPAAFPVARLGELWDAVLSTQFPPGASRVCSGPHSLLPDATCHSILQDASQRRVVRKHGPLLLSIHPPCHGGRVKDENLQLAKSRVASLLLDKGLGLPASAQAAEDLTAKAGARAVLSAVESHDPATRWTTITQLAAEHSIVLPQGDQRTAKAAVRLEKAVRRRQLAKQTSVCAADLKAHGVGLMTSPCRSMIG